MKARRLLFALAAATVACNAGAQMPDALRVCADPDNLPLSHADGSGFENRIAKLLADELKLPLQYAWLPDRRGFVRKTMGEGLCDVIIGVPAGYERTATTRPYYRSSYVLVDRRASEAAPGGFDDPRLAQWRIGVQLIGNDLAASPPGHALARHGITRQVVGFPVPGDEPAAARIVKAVARGELDAGYVWGPQAGAFAQDAGVPLRVTRVAAPADLPQVAFEYAIAVGVRRSDRALREALDAALERRQADIDRILDAYAVPRVRR